MQDMRTSGELTSPASPPHNARRMPPSPHPSSPLRPARQVIPPLDPIRDRRGTEIAAPAAPHARTERRHRKRYGALLDATSRVLGQAKRFSKEIAQGVKRATSVLKQLAPEGLRQQLDEMTPLEVTTTSTVIPR